MAFAALTIDLNARLAKFEQDMQRAGKSLDGLNSRASSAAAGLKTAFGALASTLSVGVLASFAKSGIDAADALNDMSQRLGVSVKDLASFKLAAEQSGTSLDSVGTGIARLSKSIGEAENGNKKLAETLARLGITARDPKEAFFQLADAVQRVMMCKAPAIVQGIWNVLAHEAAQREQARISALTAQTRTLRQQQLEAAFGSAA
jgi:ABC-type multidrug transport system fused ATPase/permease subunit